MHTIHNAYKKLRQSVTLEHSECDEIINDEEIQTFQHASLAIQLLHNNLERHEYHLLRTIFANFKTIESYAYLATPQHFMVKMGVAPDAPQTDEVYQHILRQTASGELIGQQSIETVISKLLDKTLDMDFLAIWFMLINYQGLDEQDLSHLTVAMTHSGDTFDYRGMDEMNNAKMIRRYPTGALGENISLIMPSIMAAIANSPDHDFNIASPFLVGHAQSSNDATWNKFKAIANFDFPLPGEQTIKAIKACKVALSEINDSFNPADKLLYQFRAITGTVPSHDLILASIASKMLACPADHLLMDVRYGKGAFLPTLARAQKLGDALSHVLTSNNAPCTYLTVSTDEPTGCAIGHSFEVLEAIAIMTGKYDDIWDEEALLLQRDLVLKFCCGLMQSQYPEHDDAYWRELGLEMIASGQAFDNFLNLLRHHQVDDATIEGIKTDPWALLAPDTQPLDIISTREGELSEIDQKQLDHLVNSKFNDELSARSGVILRKRTGQHVKVGDCICQVFFDQSFVKTADVQSIQAVFFDCFTVSFF
jgi:pyrimidine-nucleoside phosphorylase